MNSKIWIVFGVVAAAVVIGIVIYAMNTKKRQQEMEANRAAMANSGGSGNAKPSIWDLVSVGKTLYDTEKARKDQQRTAAATAGITTIQPKTL